MSVLVYLSIGSRGGPPLVFGVGAVFRSAAALSRAWREGSGPRVGSVARVMGMLPSERDMVSGLGRLSAARGGWGGSCWTGSSIVTSLEGSMMGRFMRGVAVGVLCGDGDGGGDGEWVMSGMVLMGNAGVVLIPRGGRGRGGGRCCSSACTCHQGGGGCPA